MHTFYNVFCYLLDVSYINEPNWLISSGNSQEVWKRWYLENGRAGNGADALDDYVEH